MATIEDLISVLLRLLDCVGSASSSPSNPRFPAEKPDCALSYSEFVSLRPATPELPRLPKATTDPRVVATAAATRTHVRVTGRGGYFFERTQGCRPRGSRADVPLAKLFFILSEKTGILQAPQDRNRRIRAGRGSQPAQTGQPLTGPPRKT